MKKEYGKKLVGEEEGFILVSVIVILAVLTLIGVTAMFKTNVQTKVSASSVDMAKALSAGQSGLAQNYSDWMGVRAAEKDAISKAVEAGTASSGMYDETMTPNQMSDLGADTAAVDNYVNTNGNIRVYDVTPAGLVSGTWGTGRNPQVALWAASFAKQTDPVYPYKAANTAACPDCNIVVYSLARAGKARSLQREIQGTTTHAPNGISAITNVPNTAYWATMCLQAKTTLSDRLPYGAVGEGNKATSPVLTTSLNTTHHEWMIEATQAQYAIYEAPVGNQVNIPSGVAFASNTSVGRCLVKTKDGKSEVKCPEFEVEFPAKNSENTSTVAVYSTDPLIAYSGHQSVSNMRVDYANKKRDLTTPKALSMPSGSLPHKLVNDRMLGTPGQLNFLDGSGQAFDLDAIRWGAEQFTCRTSDGGKFCGKANALKKLVYTNRTVVPSGSKAPVTGRLTFAQFQYNVANAIPMFGLVRVMYPSIPKGAPGKCAGKTVQLYETEDAGEKLIWSTGSTATDYTGSPTTIDADGQLGSSAKLIVYGSIMIDFFADDNANMRFDPAAGEHILTNLENGETKAEMQVPELINPALPNMAPGTSLSAFPGITMNGSGAINLASPTNGNFPMIEGMVPSVAGATAKQDGRMELMNPNAAGVSKLYEIGDSVHTSGGIGANTPDYFNAHKTRLEYYYKLAYASANHNDPNQWPMANFPANLSTGSKYCVGSQDCALSPAGTGPNNDGDKFHLMFPSGYMHGWKVALAALNLTAADWNGLLDGTDTLAAQTIADSTKGNKGSPFGLKDIPFDYSLKTPAKFASLKAKAKALIGANTKNHQYFYAEKGAGGYVLLTSKWADIPAFIYSGGFMQIQYVSNISGAVYTPGPMAWGAEDNLADPGTGYFNGSIITGFGFARGGEHSNSSGYAVVVFDPQAVDNSSVSTLSSVLRRFAWEQLH